MKTKSGLGKKNDLIPLVIYQQTSWKQARERPEFKYQWKTACMSAREGQAFVSGVCLA